MLHAADGRRASERLEASMPTDEEHRPTELELAEAEVESDIMDADVEGIAEAPAPASDQETFVAGDVSEEGLAEADSESDLTHADDVG
jgi:hypothetical protein